MALDAPGKGQLDQRHLDRADLKACTADKGIDVDGRGPECRDDPIAVAVGEGRIRCAFTQRLSLKLFIRRR